MATELFNANQPTTTVSSGGTTAPSPGTSETWTVASSTGFPTASNSATPPTQFHVADAATGKTTEIIAVTNVSGTTWTVTRGAEGSTPISHTAGFTIVQVVTAGFLTNVSNSLVYANAVTLYGADPTGSADSTTAIQAALTDAQAVYLPPGAYKITSALTLQTGQILAGAGMNVTTVTQNTTNTNGITGTDVAQVTLRDFKLVGTGSGTGNGIDIAPSSNTNSGYIDMENVFVFDWGGIGIHVDTPIASHFRKVLSTSNGGDGFKLTNVKGSPTSVSFDSCYANSNGTNGYELVSAAYCTMNACASDSNATGYLLTSCRSVTLNGCGAEAFTTAGWEFSGCTDCHLNGGYSSGGAGIVAWVTSSTVNQLITNLVENSPAGGATACVQTDSSTSAIVTNLSNVTANNISTGTATFTSPAQVTADNLMGSMAFTAPTGALGETCPRFAATSFSSTSLVTGTVYMRAIGLPAGVPVKNITLVTSTPQIATQVDITHGWYALCDSTRHIVAISADQPGSAVWTATNTPYTLPVLGSGGSTYITTYAGLYYIGQMVAISAGSMPMFVASGAVGVGVGSAAPVLMGPSSASQSTPPTIGTQLSAVSFANSNAFYSYVS